MSCFENDWQQRLFNEAALLGEAQAKGKLYDIGEYPGLILAENSLAKGEIYLLNIDDDTLIEFLDDYEGDEYRREKVEIDFDGSIISCWTYLYIHDTTNKTLIPDGDYQKYSTK